ncbi:MAG: hypothetical protein KatS3mg115_0200 [Candidatus Poribacteria bacterium]|nr:MAG: hypothetical protein KatS3mg115_0200 [Candidatus Poribacteria bacterium]
MVHRLWVCVGMATVLFLGVVSTARADLVAYWSFDDEDATDQTGNGHDGTLMGNVTFEEGIAGKAAVFDGSSFIQVASTPELQPEQVTATMWVRFSDVNPPRQDFFSKNDRVALSLHEWANDGRIYPIVKVGANWFVKAGNTIAEPDVWYHLAIVFDTEAVRSYLNGVLDAETAAAGALDWVNGPLTIGTYSDRFLKGAMDEVRYYNTALSEDEIVADMQGALAVRPGGKATTTWGRLKLERP